MFGFKEKLFGIAGLVGLSGLIYFGLKYDTIRQLQKYGQPLVGHVVGYQSYRTSKNARYDKVELRVRYQGCRELVEKTLEARRDDNLPEQGEIHLMSDGKCPPSVVLRDAANNAWKEALLCGILTIVGLIAVVAGLRKKG